MSSGPVPRYFEDFTVGETFEFGEYTVTREEIVAFAEQYDPQPFHTDEDAARESMYGELIASGWHTLAICSRIVVDHLLTDAKALGGTGADDVHWYQPVFPDDTLSVTLEVVETRPSNSASDRGLVRAECTVTNQRGEAVASIVPALLFERRE